MTSLVIAFYLALFAPQAVTPVTPQTSTPSLAQGAPRPNPDASGVFHMGDGVIAPRVVHQVEPGFTSEARNSKIRGVTLVNLTVDEKGKPTNVHLLRSKLGPDAAARIITVHGVGYRMVDP